MLISKPKFKLAFISFNASKNFTKWKYKTEPSIYACLSQLNDSPTCVLAGVSIHDRGFGFVQFAKSEDAQKAKDGERGTKLNGQVLGWHLTWL